MKHADFVSGGVNVRGHFDNLVAIKVDDQWIAVDTAERALELLQTLWPDTTGPSYDRAIKSCQASVDSDVSSAGAKATFAVAAMEVGMPFELHDDYFAFAAAQVASVAEAEIRLCRVDHISI